MTNENSLPPIDPQPAKTGKTRSPVWMRVALFVSLAINLLIVGVVVGTLGFKGPPGANGNPRLQDAGLGPLGAVLTSDQRRSLRSQLQERSGDIRLNRERLRNDIERLTAALRADPFDATVFENVLESQRETVQNRQIIGHNVLLSAVSDATPEERAAMADKIENALNRAKRRNKSKNGN